MCLAPVADPVAHKRNEEIEKKIKEDKKILGRDIKILLLGPGESGKSTIFKQMKILQKNGGYKHEELLEFKAIVFSNLITQMRILSTAALKANVTFTKAESKAKAEKLLSTDIEWSEEISKDISDLWSDGGIQEIYNKTDRQFVLNDSASYFF